MPYRKSRELGIYFKTLYGESMKRITLLAMIVLGIFPCFCAASEPPGIKVTLSSRTIDQGGLEFLSVGLDEGENPEVTWRGKEVRLVFRQEKKKWQGFLGADLRAKPGSYILRVTSMPSGRKRLLALEIVEKDWGVRRLTLPKKMVDLDKKTLERARRESKVMKKLWQVPTDSPRWHGKFLKPVSGEVVGPFGRRSVINKQPRSPHSGVDLRGKRGTPIKATNHGKVVLVADHFFSGRSVVIDHGGGIQSMYFHLDDITVQKDDMIEKGQVIGHMGSTGRATGPHLHWGIRMNGARVDPIGLTALSRKLEE